MKQTIKSTMMASVIAASTFAASGAVISYDGGTFTPRGDGPFTIGSLIEVGNTPITINALGVQDLSSTGNGVPAADGFFSNITVGLWDATGANLIDAVTILQDGSGSTLIDTYRYESTSATIVLAANTQYLIGAAVGSGIEWFLDADSSSATPPYSGDGVTIVESRFAFGNAAPTSAGGGNANRWAAANATFIPIPEPSSTALL